MRIAVISNSDSELRRLKELLPGPEQQKHEIVLRQGGLDELTIVVDQARPELVLLDRLCTTPEDIIVLGQVTQRYPELSFVLACDSPNPAFLLAAMQMGVRDIIAAPATAEDLGSALGRVQQRMHAASSPPHRCTVAAFLPCKGGSGATFLAANLAYILAADFGQRVLLVDLNLELGDAVLFLTDRSPPTTLADVARNVNRLDSSLLHASMLHVLPNLEVLAAPDTVEAAVEITAEQIQTIIRLAAADVDCIIIDLGRSFDRVSVKALDLADFVCPVFQLSLPFVRDAKRVLNTLRSLGVADTRIKLIVNRVERKSTLQLPDAEQALERKVALAIPNSYGAVSASVDQGIPIASIDSRNRVARCLREFAEKQFGVKGVTAASWLGQLFGAK